MVSTSDLSLHNGDVTGDLYDKALTGRKYIVIRYVVVCYRRNSY